MPDDQPDIGSIIKEWKPQAQLANIYRDYDEGRHELKFATKDFQDKYGSVVKSMRENLCPAAIAAFVDGLEIEQWGDKRAEDIAEGEGLTRLVDLVHAEAYRTGNAYTLVWPNDKGELVPHFHRSDQILARTSSDDPGMLDWAAKIWIDEERFGRVNVYYDDRVERWATVTAFPKDSKQRELSEDSAAWRRYDDDDDGDTIPYAKAFPANARPSSVPVCWWKQDARDQQSPGRSILTDVIPLQDGLNTSLAHLVVSGEGWAKPFWYLLNFQPTATNPVAIAQEYREALGSLQGLNEKSARKFDPGKQRIFTHDGPGPFGQLEPPDPSRLIAVQDAFAHKIARVIGVPSYWFTQTSGQVPSGESLRVLTTRRNSAIARFQRSATPVWRGLGQLLGMGEDITPKWASPMHVDETERVEIARGKREIGYSFADAIAGIGDSDPDGIAARAAQDREADAAAAGRGFMQGQIGY